MEWKRMRRIMLTAASCAGVVWAAVMGGQRTVQAADVELKVGDKAPDFAIPGPEGKDKHLSDYKGKKNVLVAFYPKAFTPGCTKEMCGYRDDFSKLQDQDVAVVAVSVDQQAESDRFKGEYKLPFSVVGDPDGKIVNAYGVKRVMGTLANREVFLVDKEGVIRYKDEAYDVVKGVDSLYKAIAELAPKKNAEKPSAAPETEKQTNAG